MAVGTVQAALVHASRGLTFRGQFVHLPSALLPM